jgi:hypothetical protein
MRYPGWISVRAGLFAANEVRDTLCSIIFGKSALFPSWQTHNLRHTGLQIQDQQHLRLALKK